MNQTYETKQTRQIQHNHFLKILTEITLCQALPKAPFNYVLSRFSSNLSMTQTTTNKTVSKTSQTISVLISTRLPLTLFRPYFCHYFNKTVSNTYQTISVIISARLSVKLVRPFLSLFQYDCQ